MTMNGRVGSVHRLTGVQQWAKVTKKSRLQKIGIGQGVVNLLSAPYSFPGGKLSDRIKKSIRRNTGQSETVMK
jgi:hypothetical protein